jgi:hypothetical protein
MLRFKRKLGLKSVECELDCQVGAVFLVLVMDLWLRYACGVLCASQSHTHTCVCVRACHDSPFLYWSYNVSWFH